MKRYKYFLLVALMVPAIIWAKAPALKADYPERYIIVKGDTLWDISARFLESPWRWPEIWDVNPDIKNPHLIYPGDVVALQFIDGKAVLTIEKPMKIERTRATAKLSPKIRIEQVTRPVPSISMKELGKFLARVRLMQVDNINRLPYILAFGEGHTMGGTSDRIYIKGEGLDSEKKYKIIHPGQTYTDPFSKGNPVLGIEVTYVAKASISSENSPAKGMVSQSFREAVINDRLVTAESEDIRQADFIPRIASEDLHGRIIGLVDALNMVGEYRLVVLNRGSDHGVVVGHVFAISKKGKIIYDNTVAKRNNRQVQLPDEQVGIMMAVRTYPKLTYALVMEATTDVNIGDYFVRPE